MDKVKKVAGTYLLAKSFLHVPDEHDSSTWMFPVFAPSNDKLSMNLIRGHLHRFDEQTKDLPDSLRQELWNLLRGCAIARGIPAPRRTFTAPEPVTVTTPTAPMQSTDEYIKAETQKIREAVSTADLFADQVFAQLGID